MSVQIHDNYICTLLFTDDQVIITFSHIYERHGPPMIQFYPILLLRIHDFNFNQISLCLNWNLTKIVFFSSNLIIPVLSGLLTVLLNTKKNCITYLIILFYLMSATK